MTKYYDIVIVGAALVGASAAVTLAKQGFKVALVDRKSPLVALANAEWDSRIYAISPGNADWLKDLGVWQRMDAERVTPIAEMQIWGDAIAEALNFNAEDTFANNLGYILESSALEQALWDELQTLDVDISIGYEATLFEANEQGASLQLSDGRQLKAKLMIAADGGNSWLREQAGLTQQKTVYEHVGVVANFEVELPHQHIARQWFVDDGVMAWLPSAGNRISMVFSTKHSQNLMALSPTELAEQVAQAGGNVLGKMHCITPAVAFPLVKQKASALISNRLVLTGDAAHQVHPMAGQGVNLGFRDVVELAQVLAERNPLADIGDRFLLRRYERARKADVIAIQGLTHALYTAFDSKQALVRTARNWGLSLPNKHPIIKRALMKQALI
ncbi:MAG: FAD-dependent monooxygenase [Candidatus Methylopumilus sp.]|nr:FAD-dependent monooxygenase [Candidatus Methylopumilus sp.]